MSKPKACPGKYHWLLCRHCPEKVDCGLRTSVLPKLYPKPEVVAHG